MKEMVYATRDQIIGSIHVLWERGWVVTPKSVQEMLKVGTHVECPLERIEPVMTTLVIPGVKEEWLSHFNEESPFNKEHPRPWPIGEHLHHQHIEEE